MGQPIIKIKDLYFLWSTIVDAPITYGMTLDALEKRIKDEYGRRGMEELPSRIERVEKTGTSAHEHTMRSLVAHNRAGPNECSLRWYEIYKAFQYPPQPIRDGWVNTPKGWVKQ